MSSTLRRPAAALVAAALVAGGLGVAPLAAAAGPGSVGGTVTTEGLEGVDPVAGVRVVAWAPSGDAWREAGQDLTDETGAYRIDGLAADAYRVAFESTDGTYVSEVYDNATWETATPVTVGEEAVTGVDADLELAGRITGAVENEAGDALVGATVRTYVAVADDAGGTTWEDSGIGAETDGAGAYEVRGLPAGSYRVEFSADGYLTEVYEDVATVEEGSDVDVEPGWSSELPTAVLTEGASIAGVVTDAADEPLPGVEVSVFAGDGTEAPVAYVTTEQDGSYVVDGLAADSYVVSFYSYQEDTGDLGEFYDDAATFEEATRVGVTLGQDRTGVGAQLVAGEQPGLPSFDSTAAPVISGVAMVGATLSTTSGSWVPSPSRFEYSWFRDGVRIPGATSATYLAAVADVGTRLTVRVAVTGDGYRRTSSPASAPTAPVAAVPAVIPPTPTPPSTPAPTPSPPAPVVDVPAGLAAIMADLDVKGRPKVGRTVKVTGLDMLLRTAVSYTFQWFAGAKKIKRATKSKLRITQAMKGKKVSVRVTARAASTTRSTTIKVGRVR